MRRHLPRLLLTGALLSPVTLYALGLGEIRLNSALNQPFDAEIELIAPTPDELESLKVGLASTDLFSRYGLERPSYLSNFDFTISRSRDGRATIKVRSNRSVTEPFVTLLVEASWARGRLLREYTVLLDPPVFMPSQRETPAPVTTPQSGAQTEGRIERQPAPTPQPEPTPEATPAAPAAPSDEPTAPVAAAPSATPAVVGGEYPVERNDTLWRIAHSVNPGSPSVVNRTMIALFRANPAAFNGNINRLRAGSVLRVPDLTEIEAISTGEATAEVARQTAEWSGATQTAAVEEASRLRLVTPEEAPAAPTAAPTTPEKSAADRTGATGPAAPASSDKRVAVTSPELATAQKNVEETPVEAAPSEQAPAAETATPEATEAQAAAEEPAPVVRPKRPEPKQTEPAGPTLGERIGQFWWAPVALGVLLVIGLIGVFVRRRREAEASSTLDSLAPLSFDPPGRASARGRDRADSFVVESESPVVDDDFEEPAPVAARRSETPQARPVQPVEPAASRSVDDTLSSETSVRLDQQDALAEADFHMAYGLYDQAADLVKIAIDREPTRRDLKLKLLEIYFVWGNKDLFLDTARDLHGSRAAAPAGEWDKVLIMGKQIAADDPMFKGEASGGLDLVDVNLEGGENRVDVDLFAEPELDQPAGLDLEFASGERKSTASSDSDLDFLLDSDSGEQTREYDPLARTQETPTIESPMLDRGSSTIRERAEKATFGKASGEQTAELSIDDLGLDVNAIDSSGSLEDTTSLERDTNESAAPSLSDEEMTQLAPSLGSLDRTMEAPRPTRFENAKTSDTGRFDIESTGTIFIDQVDLSGGDTVEQRRPEVDSTASMKRPGKLDVDLDHLSGAHGGTVRQPRAGEFDADEFSSDVFADRTAQSPRIDLDVGEALSSDDHAPTNKQITTEMELSELEPVTMSEVGTKLDLARAYMDMGDPDGARSILDEVLAEGTPNQKQEAQRLMESIR